RRGLCQVRCTATSVYNWRSGKTTPRIDQLLQLSDRLRIPIAAFLLRGRAAGAVDWRVNPPRDPNHADQAPVPRGKRSYAFANPLAGAICKRMKQISWSLVRSSASVQLFFYLP